MIIKRTAFCSNKTCCPVISIDTDANTITITDDYNGVLTAHRGIFLVVNHYAQKLNEGAIEVSGVAMFKEPEYTLTIKSRDEVYYLSLEHQGQKVKRITLEQWNILAYAVYKSYQPSFVLDEELVNA